VLVETLGTGGIATVWRAVDNVLGVERAVKLLDDDAARSPVFRSRFLTEARVMARLVHPNILPVFDYGREHGRYYLVMELLEDGSVTDLLRATKPLPEDRALRIAFDVLQALAAVHATGTIHRDVKPGNVLIGADGAARLSDFGIVRLNDARPLHQQNTPDLVGTTGYIAPEGRTEVDALTARTDLYGVGDTLFAMTTARHPAVLERLDRHAEYLDGLSPRTAEIIRRATRRDPDERYPDARTMAQAVAEAYDALGTDPDGPVEKAWMARLDDAFQRTIAHVQALATRPPPPTRTGTGGHRVHLPRGNPRLAQRESMVQTLTLVLGVVSGVIAVVILVILAMS